MKTINITFTAILLTIVQQEMPSAIPNPMPIILPRPSKSNWTWTKRTC